MASYVPSADQRLLRDEVRRVLAGDHPFEPRGTWTDIWPQATELGWPLAMAPERVGGIGGLAEAALLAEEFGRALRPEPFDLIGAITHAALAVSEHSAAAAALIEGILEGEVRPAFSPAPTFEAVATAEGWRFSGKTDCVWGATGATEVLVAACAAGLLIVGRVPLTAPGVTVLTAAAFDGSTTARISLVEVGVAKAAILDAGEDFIAVASAAYLVLASATALGDMARSLEISAEYIKTRKQFGVELASFQALQHHLADAHVELELARSMVSLGVETLLNDEGARARARVASAVKARVGEAALAVGARAIQLHGGVGVTEEYEVGRHYRRLLRFELEAGSRAFHLQRFAEITA